VAQIDFLYRIDIGFSVSRGYAASLTDVRLDRSKGIKANSIEQLMSRLRRVILDEEGRRKHFPLESEPSRIITPNGF
jgi:hypothetical protein